LGKSLRVNMDMINLGVMDIDLIKFDVIDLAFGGYEIRTD
jgi:hypothetical protein